VGRRLDGIISIGTGIQAGESPEVDFPETRPLNDTDPVYF
jgi:hypothetical protein